MTQTDKSFVQFQSMAYGYRAAWKVLDTYCLRFTREREAFNVRNIIARWAPPSENDSDAYIRTVVSLSGLGGYENIPRPNRYRPIAGRHDLCGVWSPLEGGGLGCHLARVRPGLAGPSPSAETNPRRGVRGTIRLG